MPLPNRRRLLQLASASACAALGLAGLAGALPARAEAPPWPARPITFIIPGAPGGVTDAPLRVLAQRLGQRLGRPIIIDTKPGAGGMLGASLIARARPDGYTVLAGNTGSNSINYTTYEKKITYKPEDFVALTDMISFSNVLVVPANSPIQSLGDLIAAARKHPGKLAFSSAGIGQTTHLMGELFRQRAGVDVVHVPYKGSAPATLAIVSGETQFMFDNVTGSLGHIRAGKLRALAVSSATRDPQLPDVPTMTELGMTGFDKVGWMGFFLPAKTPPEIVRKLTENLIAVLHEPEVIARYREIGGRAGGMPSGQFEQLVQRDAADWGELIRSQHLQVD